MKRQTASKLVDIENILRQIIPDSEGVSYALLGDAHIAVLEDRHLLNGNDVLLKHNDDFLCGKYECIEAVNLIVLNFYNSEKPPLLLDKHEVEFVKYVRCILDIEDVTQYSQSMYAR